MRDPIIVAGCPRSGTSLTMGALQICGAFVGPYAKSPDNPKGTFENLEILSLMLRRWRRCNPNPYDEVRDRLMKQGYKRGPWAFKLSGRMLDYFMCAHEMWPDASWVVVRRDMAGILASHRARGDYLARGKINQAQMVLDQIGSTIRPYELWPQRVIGGERNLLFELIDECLGLEWKPDEIEAFIEPGLWRYGSASG